MNATAARKDAEDICRACPAYVADEEPNRRCEYWYMRDENRPICARHTYPHAAALVALLDDPTNVEISVRIADAAPVFAAMDAAGWKHTGDYMPCPHVTANIYTRNHARAVVRVQEK